MHHPRITGLWVAALLLVMGGGLLRAEPPLPPKPARYFNDYANIVPAADGQRINSKLEQFERDTSNQVLVAIFPKTGTAQRNGILFYIVPRSQNFAILGDEGIHAKVGDGFWQELASMLSASFREGCLTEGLEETIRRAGDLLAEFFPPLPGDQNELPDQPTGGM